VDGARGRVAPGTSVVTGGQRRCCGTARNRTDHGARRDIGEGEPLTGGARDF
jgi:hypothetical protein